MSTLPKVERDANGLPIIKGVQDQPQYYTKNQVEVSDILGQAARLKGATGDNIVKLLKDNPANAAGLIVSSGLAGLTPGNSLTKNLVELNRVTKEAQALDTQEKYNLESTKKFEATFAGKAWRLLKQTTRGLTAISQFPIEMVNTQFSLAAKELSGIYHQWADGKKINKDQAIADYKNAYAQTTLGQSISDVVGGRGVHLGSGFFPSESEGAGLAARKKQLETFGIKVNGKLDENGHQIYRPYSFVDPVSWMLTGGAYGGKWFGGLEGHTAQVMDGVGELVASFYIDPLIVASKIGKANEIVKGAERTRKGLASSKNIVAQKELLLKQEEYANNIKTMRTELLSKNLSKIARTSINRKLKNAVQQETKIQDAYGNINVNPEDIANFVSGKYMSPVIDKIITISSPAKIIELGKGKIPAKLASDLANAKTREEVLRSFAPYVNNGDVVAGILKTGTTVGRSQTLARVSGIRALSRSQHVQNIGRGLADLYNGTPIAGKVGKVASGIQRKYNTIIPNGALFNVNDLDALVETARNHLSVGKVSAVESEKLLNEIITAKSASESAYKASAGVFDAIFKANADKLSPKLLEQLKEATRIFEKGQKELSSYWASMHVQGANIDILASLGGKTTTISGAHLDSELLHEHVFIPGAKDIMDIISRVNKVPLGGATRDALDFAIGDVWKKIQLVRPAFVVRNIMEEQIRVFAVGHNSAFNHPIAFAAMWLGRDNGPAWRRMLAQYDRTRYTLPGKEFKALTKEDETAQLNSALGAKNSYVNSVSNAELGSSDIRIDRVLQNNNITAVGIRHPRAWDGIANQIRILRNSSFGRKVAQTADNDQARAETLDYFLTGKGRGALERYVSAKGTEAEVLFERDTLNKFLFTGRNAAGISTSVLGRIDELTGGLKQFREVIATGKIALGDKVIEIPTIEQEAALLKASKSFLKVPIKNGNSSIHRGFANELKDAFASNGKWEDNFLVNVPEKVASAGSKTEKSFLNRTTDAFFDIAVGFEKTTTMGPEYQMTYWDTIRSLSTSLDADAIKALEEVANKTLPKIRNIAGVPVGRNHPVWDAFKMTDKSNPGILTLDEAHNYASKVAANRVKDLFYNATEKNQFFHQFRLIIPFGQAWENTIKEWAKLSFDNPVQVYKLSKTLDWLSSSKSSAIYGLTDVKDFYDPNQGFFFNDPQTNEKRFWVPFAGTLMTAASNTFAGRSPFSGGTPIAFSASPSSFNFAIGSGSILPPIGPGVNIPIAVLDSIGMNPTDMFPDSYRKSIESYIAPFGNKDLSTGLGIFDSFLSGNWSRILGSIGGTESGYAAAFKPTMTYLANSGDFNLQDPLDQARLVEQTNHFARYFSFFRGITGMNSPATLIPEALANDKDGKATLQTALWNDFKTIEQNNNNNRDKSYADFFDLYGPEQVFALTSNKAGASGLPTYELIKKDPTVLAKFPDIFGYIYPNANFSQAMYTWSLKNAGGRMSAQDIMDQADDLRFYAAKDRLLTRATAENWTKDQQTAAMNSLKASYGGGINKLIDVGMNDKVKLQLREASQDPKFADSDAMTGTRDFLYLYDIALGKAKESGMTTLNNKASAPIRDWLIGESAKIIQRNPGFQKIFWAFFSNELGA